MIENKEQSRLRVELENIYSKTGEICILNVVFHLSTTTKDLLRC